MVDGVWKIVDNKIEYLNPARRIYEENKRISEESLKTFIEARAPRAICSTLFQVAVAVPGVPAKAIICGVCADSWAGMRNDLGNQE